MDYDNIYDLNNPTYTLQQKYGYLLDDIPVAYHEEFDKYYRSNSPADIHCILDNWLDHPVIKYKFQVMIGTKSALLLPFIEKKY